MDLVEDDDLSSQSEATDKEVFHRHHGLKRLINGANAISCEQRMLGRRKPRAGLVDVPICSILVFLLPGLK